MMQYKIFRKLLKKHISDTFSYGGYRVTEITVDKRNVKLEAFCLSNGISMAAPIIYPEHWYDEFKLSRNFEEVARHACEVLRRGIEVEDIHFDLSPDRMMETLNLSLINYEKNRSMLEGCPHIVIEDLACILKWWPTSTGRCILDNSCLKALGMNKEELFSVAERNLEKQTFEFQSIYDYLGEYLDLIARDRIVIDDNCRESVDMYVISNPAKFDGSCAVLSKGFMDNVMRSLDRDEFIVLPSSVNELILIPPEQVENPWDFRCMVREINRSSVDKEDFLSDNIYRYKGKEHSLEMIELN